VVRVNLINSKKATFFYKGAF